MILRDLCVAALLAAVAAPAAASPGSAPDAHILHRPRGDVIVDGGRLKTPLRPAPRVGTRLERELYAPRLRISEPARHGLPATRGAEHWVRHGGDLLLVDVRGGRVLRVVRRSAAGRNK